MCKTLPVEVLPVVRGHAFITPKAFGLLAVLVAFGSILSGCGAPVPVSSELNAVRTIAGERFTIGEPFGIAEKDGVLFVTDGAEGRVIKVLADGTTRVLAEGLDTPSGIDLGGDGSLIVADSGSHEIIKIYMDGRRESVAGVSEKPGFRDGPAGAARFRGPVGIAVDGDSIFVSDTYNDRVRRIKDGKVTTLAGGDRGFRDDENGSLVKFDTPCGLDVWDDGRLIVADAGNRSVRIVERDGKTWTLTGTGGDGRKDGLFGEAVFRRPVAVRVGNAGEIYVADANTVRAIGRRFPPTVETVSGDEPGAVDGPAGVARFSRLGGIAIDAGGRLFVTDSANRLIRVIYGAADDGRGVPAKRVSARSMEPVGEPSRWPFRDPGRPREIAGTFGEIRGEIDGRHSAYFHNGLDIPGGYGEDATLISDTKVLDPLAVRNFGTERELLSLPGMAYIHIRVGRTKNNVAFQDNRFLFSLVGENVTGVRAPRGSAFYAGEVVGTLNEMNHIHLVSGAPGSETNGLANLGLPALEDTVPPMITGVRIFSGDWSEIETREGGGRIYTPKGDFRVVVEAFDRMDLNKPRRRLGIYRLGAVLVKKADLEASGSGPESWALQFDQLPPARFTEKVFYSGSRSGAEGKTVFRYIVTNRFAAGIVTEGFISIGGRDSGEYQLRVFAEDKNGNRAVDSVTVLIE